MFWNTYILTAISDQNRGHLSQYLSLWRVCIFCSQNILAVRLFLTFLWRLEDFLIQRDYLNPVSFIGYLSTSTFSSKTLHLDLVNTRSTRPIYHITAVGRLFSANSIHVFTCPQFFLIFLTQSLAINLQDQEYLALNYCTFENFFLL